MLNKLEYPLPRTYFFKGKNGKHYWTAYAKNGRIVAASSQGFYSKSNAERNYEIVCFELAYYPCSF